MAATKEQWDIIRSVLNGTTAITFDGCHKIYLVLDEEQREQMVGWGYDMIDVEDADEALETLQDWYEDSSCGLHFIQSVRTVPGDPNKGFVNLIPQGA